MMLAIRPFVVAASLALAGLGHAAPISGQGTWASTLQARYFTADHSKGPQAYFDTDLNITWLANTIYPHSEPISAGMKWRTADDRASLLNVGGTTGWRLPSADANEFAHLYSVTLGNDASLIKAGQLQLNTGPFANVLPVDNYWMHETTPKVDGFQTAWQFDFSTGKQHLGLTDHDSAAWFVHSGDVLAVPEPSTMALALVGLAVIGGGMRAKRRHHQGA